MSRRTCRNEGCDGTLEIQGIAGFNDLIEVQCNKCEDVYEVEPDGLGDGGLEMVDAMMIAMENGDIDPEDMDMF
jgi:hypothetical protein